MPPACSCRPTGRPPRDDLWEHRLVSVAVPLLLAERGDIALHAAAVARGDRAVAFAGASTRGKSTLAVAAAACGARRAGGRRSRVRGCRRGAGRMARSRRSAGCGSWHRPEVDVDAWCCPAAARPPGSDRDPGPLGRRAYRARPALAVGSRAGTRAVADLRRERPASRCSAECRMARRACARVPLSPSERARRACLRRWRRSSTAFSVSPASDSAQRAPCMARDERRAGRPRRLPTVPSRPALVGTTTAWR